MERIKRMSVLPANGDGTILNPNDVAIYFCNSDPSQSRKHLSLKLNASIPTWIALYDKSATHIIDSCTIPVLDAYRSYKHVDNMWLFKIQWNQ